MELPHVYWEGLDRGSKEGMNSKPQKAKGPDTFV